jgi:hypothetical protein
MRIAACLIALILVAPAAATPPAQEAKQDPKLVAIGGLSVTALYMSFVTVGVTADAFGKEAYEAKQVADMMTEVSNLMKTNSRQLGAIPREGIAKEEVTYIDEITAVMGMIGEYSQLLSAYAKDKTEAKAKAFDQKREATWVRLKKLLGLK